MKSGKVCQLIFANLFLFSQFIPQKITAQKFEPNLKSIAENYQCPEWFRDAKFGIFMHWGIMSAIDENRQYGGSWYAKYMYGPGEGDSKKDSIGAAKVMAWHIKRYGDLNKFGYKDFIPLFKAEKWNPDSLVGFYKEIGAKYIVPVAVHHDNFDMYKSMNPWNSYNMGPHKDILKGWKEAADKYGMRFGVSSHVDRAPYFLKTARKYDGADPKYADFYCSNYKIDFEKDDKWMKYWFMRTKEIIDNYKPDLIYFDGGLPGNQGKMNYGYELAAHYYNESMKNHNGKLEAVLNLKYGPDKRAFVWDIERGQLEFLRADPWQTDTDIQRSGWFYWKCDNGFTADILVGNLIDIVSKNGNLLLNVGLRSDGTLPENQIALLREIGAWLKVNGEGIYGTRPWFVYGEGPTKTQAGSFKEQRNSYTAQDIRFTTKGGYLYAFVLNTPTKEVSIKSLSSTLTLIGKINEIQMLGSNEKIKFERTADALIIQLPSTLPSNYALCFKMKLDETNVPTYEVKLKE